MIFDLNDLLLESFMEQEKMREFSILGDLFL